MRHLDAGHHISSHLSARFSRDGALAAATALATVSDVRGPACSLQLQAEPLSRLLRLQLQSCATCSIRDGSGVQAQQLEGALIN